MIEFFYYPSRRCIFTNINPLTGERHPNQQPLATLNERRTIIPNEAPVLGVHLGIRLAGKVSIGDDVYVEDETLP